MLPALCAVDVFLEAYKDELPATTSSGTRLRFADALAQLELRVQMQAASPVISKGLRHSPLPAPAPAGESDPRR
jgi:hypothetical protein